MATDPKERQALETFRAVLSDRYGADLKAVYLFGSRARGDHHPDSDADVAVFVDSKDRTRDDLIREQIDLSADAYDIWLDTDVRIQPWVFASEALLHLERDKNAHLLSSILAEGAAA